MQAVTGSGLTVTRRPFDGLRVTDVPKEKQNNQVTRRSNADLTFGRDRFTVGPMQRDRQYSFATAGFYYFTHAQRALC